MTERKKIHRISLRISDREYDILTQRTHRKVVLNGEEFDAVVPISVVIRELIEMVDY